MEFIILSFATFGLAEAIHNTDGPFSIFYKLRHMKYSKPFECFTCLSFWVAMPLALITASDWESWLMYGLGAAGAAIFANYIADL